MISSNHESADTLKVLLIFRSHQKGGKSIEGLFQRFLKEHSSEIEFVRWEYDQARSLFSNMLSLRRQKADIWHITGDIYYLAIGLWDKKVMMTIHDFGLYKHLNGWKKWIFHWVWIKWPLRAAHTVAAVSAYTRVEILRLGGNLFNDKIKVVQNACHPLYTGPPGIFNELRPRILQLGTAPHKNLETVIDAVSGMECTLSVIGILTDKQRTSLCDANITFENYQDLTEAEVKEQYTLSDIVVFPSLHEGFGLPVIEAQAMGRPVITSCLASLPEVAGTGAHYLDDPLDVNELRRAICKIIDHDEYRKKLIEEGYKNAQRFSWPIMRDAYIKLYKNMMTS